VQDIIYSTELTKYGCPTPVTNDSIFLPREFKKLVKPFALRTMCDESNIVSSEELRMYCNSVASKFIEDFGAEFLEDLNLRKSDVPDDFYDTFFPENTCYSRRVDGNTCVSPRVDHTTLLFAEGGQERGPDLLFAEGGRNNLFFHGGWADTLSYLRREGGQESG
jgi:hypothetical protein